MQAGNLKLAGATIALAALVAGCSAPDSAPPATSYAGYPRISNLVAGQVEVCKFTVGTGDDLTPLTSPQTSGYMTVVAQPSGTKILDNVLVTSINEATTSDYCSAPVAMPAGTTSLDVTEVPGPTSALRFYRFSEDGVMQFNPANPGNYEFYVPGGPTHQSFTANIPATPDKYYTIYMKNVAYTPPPSGGCTYTQGYWKTHSTYGPASKPDATWGAVGGPDAAFFISGASWYSVFWTAPQGNAYYNLAHQYMAAKLNLLSGDSSTPAVDAAIAGAEAFFAANAPTTVITRAQRNQLLAWASTLDQYNNGLIGPGHCSDEATQ